MPDLFSAPGRSCIIHCSAGQALGDDGAVDEEAAVALRAAVFS
jgi:hypothetical protein